MRDVCFWSLRWCCWNWNLLLFNLLFLNHLPPSTFRSSLLGRLSTISPWLQTPPSSLVTQSLRRSWRSFSAADPASYLRLPYSSFFVSSSQLVAFKGAASSLRVESFPPPAAEAVQCWIWIRPESIFSNPSPFFHVGQIDG